MFFLNRGFLAECVTLLYNGMFIKIIQANEFSSNYPNQDEMAIFQNLDKR